MVNSYSFNVIDVSNTLRDIYYQFICIVAWKVVYNDDKIMDIIIGRILVGVIRESQIILFLL
jgi:hypothetical protein